MIKYNALPFGDKFPSPICGHHLLAPRTGNKERGKDYFQYSSKQYSLEFYAKCLKTVGGQLSFDFIPSLVGVVMYRYILFHAFSSVPTIFHQLSHSARVSVWEICENHFAFPKQPDLLIQHTYFLDHSYKGVQY